MAKRWRKIGGWGTAAPGGSTEKKPGHIGGDEGATLVETTFAMVIVFMLLFGVLDFSLAFYTYHYVSDAAREGARYASVRGSDCSKNMGGAPPTAFNCNATESQIATYVTHLGCSSTSSSANGCYPGIDAADNMTVTVNTASEGTPGSQTWTSCGEGTSCNAPGDVVQVNVTYIFTFPLRIPRWTGAGWAPWQPSIKIGSTSSMMYAQ